MENYYKETESNTYQITSRGVERMLFQLGILEKA